MGYVKQEIKLLLSCVVTDAVYVCFETHADVNFTFPCIVTLIHVGKPGDLHGAATEWGKIKANMQHYMKYQDQAAAKNAEPVILTEKEKELKALHIKNEI